MSTSGMHIDRTLPGKKHGFSWHRWAAVLLLVLLPSRALALDTEVLVKSLLLPGTGQAQQGRYTSAVVFAGCAVLSGFGLILTQVYYNEAVAKYNASKKTYETFRTDLAAGNVVSIADLNSTYDAMQADHHAADYNFAWRNWCLGALIATYTVNVVDVLISKPYNADQPPRVSAELTPGGARIVGTFRF